MAQDTVSNKLEKETENKMRSISRSLAVRVSEIYDKYQKRYELDSSGRVAMTIKNVGINTDMQVEIDRQIKIHTAIMQTVLDKSIFKEVLNAVIASFKAAGYKTKKSQPALATIGG